MKSPSVPASPAIPLPGNQLEQAVTRLTRGQEQAWALISGWQLAPGGPGRTPGHWRDRTDFTPTLDEEFLLACARRFGTPFAWPTQQNGRIVHDIIPIRGHETDQLGCGSTAPLLFHTEDAFHPNRPRFLLLMCMRNPDAIPTRVGTLDIQSLSPRERQILGERRYVIRPDPSHLDGSTGSTNVAPADRAEIDLRLENPEPIAVLGRKDGITTLRIDPAYMDVADAEDREASRALARACEVITCDLEAVALQPGEILVVDNYRAVHARDPFVARYDGTDRWLKRVLVASDQAHT